MNKRMTFQDALKILVEDGRDVVEKKYKPSYVWNGEDYEIAGYGTVRI